MRKMARCPSSFKQQKHQQKQKIKEYMKDLISRLPDEILVYDYLDTQRKEHMKDRISRLPDEILIAILSLLTLKEAACTSILSCRWRYLWRYITGSLNFDSKTLRAPADANSSFELIKLTYVSWVNEVMKLHRGACIDEMRISFNFLGRYPRDISDWIRFAMVKGVQRFELDVSLGKSPGMIRSYDFPSMEKFKFLLSSNTVKSRTSNSHHVSQTIGSAGFYSLTSLRLVGVNITEEVLEYFLSNCPFLEQLCVVGSTCLVNLKIAGPSLKLKCLEISYCRYLENLEISAINLVSFTYIGPDISVPFRNVPILSELSIGGEYCSSFVSGSCKHSSYIPQIEKLSLDLPLEDFNGFPMRFRELCSVKQVELVIKGEAGDNLLSFTSVIKASPNLTKFSAQLLLYRLPKKSLKFRQQIEQKLDRFFSVSFDKSEFIESKRAATKCHHQCLKVVELVGWMGTASEIDLVLHLLEIASSLDKIIIDPHNVFYPYNRKTEAARKRARQLKKILPATVELVIL